MYCNISSLVNPLVAEFKIPEPINAEDKMAAPRRVPISLCITLLVLSYSRNGFSKDFTWYDSDPGGSLVALIIRRCLNATEATMKTARSVEEDGCEVNESVGCEAEGLHFLHLIPAHMTLPRP